MLLRTVGPFRYSIDEDSWVYRKFSMCGYDLKDLFPSVFANEDKKVMFSCYTHKAKDRVKVEVGEYDFDIIVNGDYKSLDTSIDKFMARNLPKTFYVSAKVV